MDYITQALADYVCARGIPIKDIALRTRLSYMKLYRSLSKGQDGRERRPITAYEYFKVCRELSIDPMQFAEGGHYDQR